MKSFIAQIATILISILALISCGNDAVMNDATNLGNGKMVQSVSIKAADFQYEDASRSSVNITDWGVYFYWEESDSVGIFPTEGSQVYFAMNEGEGMQTATFNGGGWALKSSSSYAAYYPYNILNRYVTNIPVNYEGQKQSYNDCTEHLGTYDYMASTLTQAYDDNVYFDLNHMGCLVMLKIQTEPYKYFSRVMLKADNNIFTAKGYIDLTVRWPEITPQRTFTTLSVDLEDFYVDETGMATIYFMMAPVDLSYQPLEILLTDEYGESLKYVAEGKCFSAGMAYAYFLADGEPVTIPPSPTYVDLGLPSGTLWADRNVGADSPDAYGNLFAWGETEEKPIEQYTQEHYNRISDSVLPLQYDAAYVNMGPDWRTPTIDEVRELLAYCKRTWVCRDSGEYGLLLTGSNGNSIFLPAAGEALYSAADRHLHFASSSHLGNGGCGYYMTTTAGQPLGFTKDIQTVANYGVSDYRGYSVRAVVR